MSNYTRYYRSGGCFFFTVVTYNRVPLFDDQSNIQKLRAAFSQVNGCYPFVMDAIVILPDHLHCLWQLPVGDNDFSTRWRYIKTQFSKTCMSSVNNRGEKKIWQRRFWEHCIRDEEDWRRHMDYIFYNPVRHGLVNSVEQWPYSSFKQALRKGWYQKGWGSSVPESISDLNLE